MSMSHRPDIETVALLLSDVRTFCPEAESLSANDVYAVAAFYDQPPLPHSDLHCRIECHSLSTCGITFFWPRKPNAHLALIGLGRAPNTIYLTADIVASPPVPDDSRFLVCCQFLGKVDL